MAINTKVTLSAMELRLAQNKEFILTKRKIMERASLLFSSMLPVITDVFKPIVNGNEELEKSIPKISAGEKYNGYPYIVFDYPAYFDKEKVFAVRTMFWWGHFTSITLQLSGVYKTKYEAFIIKNIQQHPQVYIAVGPSAWEHHFEESNYVHANTLSIGELQGMVNKQFLKIALKYELSEWNNMPKQLAQGYQLMATLLG